TESRVRELVERVVAGCGGSRRLLAALCAAVAVLATIRAVTPAPPRTVAVWAAARDLTGGAPLATGDVRLVALTGSVVPAGALRAGVQVVGRFLAAPVRRGEPLTDVRLLGPS